MLLLTTLGSLTQIRAAADELDRHDPSPADSVSWFEENPGKFRLEVYVPTKQDADSARAIVGAAAPELHLVQKKIKPADWVAMALEGLPAVRAGRFVVAGAHALQGDHSGRVKIWIEASEAFGTGHHGTTWGCLMALESVLRERRVERVLDMGAGSGVLAIAAAKQGADALAIEIDHRAAAIEDPPLNNGDRLTQAEFHRRYSAYPEDVKFELIGGTVYMASPLRRPHGLYEEELAFAFGMYRRATLGVELLPNTTAILGDDSEPQPDLSLRLLPEYGGRSRENRRKYIEGPPELLAEIAYSSRAIDMHQKKRDYRLAGVQEYLVLCIEPGELHWFRFPRSLITADAKTPSKSLVSTGPPMSMMPVAAAEVKFFTASSCSVLNAILLCICPPNAGRALARLR